MKRITFTLSIVALLAATLHAAAPVVSNLSASQRAGTKLVDIVYDVAADTSSVDISLEVSSDGGSSFTVPATSLSGAIGAGVAVGTGKTITWDAGADWNQQSSSTMRFKVTADDGVEAPAIPGMAYIPGGSFQMGDALDGMSPVVTVNVSAFYMGQYEVTKAEWDEVRTWGLSNGYTDLPTGGGKAANHPVHSINWYAMVKWCNARSEMEGRTPVLHV
jgi:formylglycine-generating enzyme required for sulfatase activity